MQEPLPRTSNLPGSRVERYGPSIARPWRSPGDPELRSTGVGVFALWLVGALVVLASTAMDGGLPDPWVWAYAIAIIATDIAELPVSTSRGGEYKVVVNDVLVLVPFATFPTHDVAWLLVVVTVVSPLLLPLSWGMRFAHASSGLAYRMLLWAAASATIALGGSPYVAVAAMVFASVAYEFTLFWPVAHVLVRSGGRPWRAFVREAVPIQVVLVGVDLPLGLVAVAAAEQAPWSVPLLAAPILIAWRLALLGSRVRELSEADRMRTRFIATASHELQTPLTSVVGFAATLEARWEQLDAEQRRSFLAIIRDQGERLSRLVAQMLVLSNSNATPAANAGPVDVGQLVHAAVLDAGLSGAEVTMDIEPGLTLACSEEDAMRVLVNLLANARKYGREPIEVRADRTRGAWVVLRVVDHGDGIPPGERDRVFEHFARGADVPSNVDGSGLGLAIARAAARRHGGEVDYEFVAGAGACFVVRLPRADAIDGVATSTPVRSSSEAIRTGSSSPSTISRSAPDTSSTTGE